MDIRIHLRGRRKKKVCRRGETDTRVLSESLLREAIGNELTPMPHKKESQNVEWKQTWRDEYLKWICGFANAQGGRIYIGKDDAGRIVGLNNSKRLLEDLPNKIRDHLGLMPPVDLRQDGDKDYLEIIVDPSVVPVSFRGVYYWRSGGVNQVLKGHALNSFLLKKMGITWDRVIEEKAKLEDIDQTAIRIFKKDSIKAGRLPDLDDLSDQKILEKLNLVTREGLTRAALVLFGKNPGEFYSNLFVKIGRFGAGASDLRFQEVCEGNLITILREVMEQLEKKFLIKPVRFEGIHRIEELEYPAAALREMLLNALAHRNYMGSMTQMGIYDHKLTLWNSGVLPDELTIEQLFQSHRSIPRNPLIAEVCYKAGYIDSWGRGVAKIIDACRQAQLPDPRYSEESGGMLVTLMKSRVNTVDYEGMSEQGSEDFGKNSERFRKDFGKISERIRKDFGNEVSKAFEVICDHPEFTAAQIADTLGKTSRTVERYITKMKKAGLIQRRGPKLGGHWEIIGY